MTHLNLQNYILLNFDLVFIVEVIDINYIQEIEDFLVVGIVVDYVNLKQVIITVIASNY